MNKRILLLMAVLLTGALQAPGAYGHAPEAAKGALVLFLTQTDGSVAGHAIHIATRMHDEGRNTTVVLTGEALRLAVKTATTERSAISGVSLQDALQAFIKAGGDVFYTPPSLAVIGAVPKDLIEGVTPPKDHAGLHEHMFASRTKLMVF